MKTIRNDTNATKGDLTLETLGANPQASITTRRLPRFGDTTGSGIARTFKFQIEQGGANAQVMQRAD
jgi:hypothetical protein